MECRSRPLELAKLSVPGLAYTIQNNLIFLSVDLLSAAVQQVTYQLKILCAALLSVLMIKKKVTFKQWISLFILVAGVILVQAPQDKQRRNGITQGTLGFLAALGACFASGFGGAARAVGAFSMLFEASQGFEATRGVHGDGLEELELHLVAQHATGGLWGPVQLCGSYGGRATWGRLLEATCRNRAFAPTFPRFRCACTTLGTLPEAVSSSFAPSGFTFWVWLMACTVASGGLLVAAVLKYADNILRQFSTAISVILTTALSALVLEDITLDLSFGVGTALVLQATFMYSGLLDRSLPSWML